MGGVPESKKSLHYVADRRDRIPPPAGDLNIEVRGKGVFEILLFKIFHARRVAEKPHQINVLGLDHAVGLVVRAVRGVSPHNSLALGTPQKIMAFLGIEKIRFHHGFTLSEKLRLKTLFSLYPLQSGIGQ